MHVSGTISNSFPSNISRQSSSNLKNTSISSSGFSLSNLLSAPKWPFSSISMAPPPPNGETFVGSYIRNNAQKPPRLSMEGLQLTISDLSFELSREEMGAKLPAISEVEDVKCECCGLCEECTPEYIRHVREGYFGKWICGLCGEAVKEEIEKKGVGKEEALNEHMKVCVRFNKIGRAYPVLYQAEVMREILKKSSLEGRGVRSKSNSPRDRGGPQKVGITRSSSCIPAITREMNGRMGEIVREMGIWNNEGNERSDGEGNYDGDERLDGSTNHEGDGRSDVSGNQKVDIGGSILD
ncbi:uncharacterized protein LOC131224044 [Magnolia sinica]|uniref:uncharacterized protein LOC131224044 n=1 Tax=Magnolia sinica TaxID=86752 RepID=UPI002659A9EF|nr:uncharacterized protein LOC131224044 [Magnolia sinica]